MRRTAAARGTLLASSINRCGVRHNNVNTNAITLRIGHKRSWKGYRNNAHNTREQNLLASSMGAVVAVVGGVVGGGLVLTSHLKNSKQIFADEKVTFDEATREQIKNLFKEYDLNGDGKISLEEFQEVFKKKGKNATLEELEQLFATADLNSDHTIDIEEFMVVMKAVYDIRSKFDALDADHSGYLDMQEMLVFAKEIDAQNPDLASFVQKLVKEVDENSDGKISFEEFQSMYLKYKRGELIVANKTLAAPDADKKKWNEVGFREWIWISNDLMHVDSEGVLGHSQLKSLFMGFVLAGASCGSATIFTNPIDVIKTRMQVAKTSAGGKIGMGSTAASMLKNEGWIVFWVGMNPSLMRSFSYSAIRLACYDHAKVIVGADTQPTLGRKVAAGCLSGSLAAAISNPIEVVKIRMQADSHRYKNSLQGFLAVARNEGIKGFGSGLTANILRGAMITSTQVGSYDHIKHTLLETGYVTEGMTLNLAASMVAGLITTTASSPFDVIKTRVMESGKSGSIVTEIINLYKNEGMRGFMRGWLPNYSRLGPHTMITLVTFEKLRDWFGMRQI